MKINPVRKIFHRIGIDVRKYNVEPDRLGWLRDMNIQTVIDIGANTGQFAREIRSALPDAFIYSFEPMRDCYEKLLTMQITFSKFKVYNCALGDTHSQSVINRNTYSPSSSLLEMSDTLKTLFPNSNNSTAEDITINRLDDVLKPSSLSKNILFKIDAQGYEDKIMRGGLNVLDASKVILVETSFVELYVGQPLFADIYTFLSKRGFVYKGAYQQKINTKTGEVIFEDSIFVKQ